KGGIGAVVEALAAHLPRHRIRTSASVTAAHLRKDGVSLHLRDGGDIAARHVLFALPPRLMEQEISFTPELSSDMRARWRGVPTWMAPHAKFLAVYAHPFWRAAGLSGTAQSMAGPMTEIHDASRTAEGAGAALFGFLGVPAAARARAGEAAIRQ